MTVENEFKVSMEDRKQTYVIIPAYNEETRVRPVIEAIADMGFKIILVNDGSTDGTLDILRMFKGNILKIFLFILMLLIVVSD